MKVYLSATIHLEDPERFEATDFRGTAEEMTIVTHRISKTGLRNEIFFCHGPKISKAGTVMVDDEGCVMLLADALPVPLLEKIQAALAPHLAVRGSTGSEAARQAALG